jgi:hypothetical protein
MPCAVAALNRGGSAAPCGISAVPGPIKLYVYERGMAAAIADPQIERCCRCGSRPARRRNCEVVLQLDYRSYSGQVTVPGAGLFVNGTRPAVSL